MEIFKLFFIIGLLFSPLAAIMGFIITYEEYRRHYSEKQKPFRIALNSAIATLIVFMLITVLGGILLARIYSVN
ncbi:MAG: hypothetical protein VB084_02670 [Syntrophomonadaceae bacterium]|nr:hypothetical protein [Syntrophomonadaceae bacterium]